MNFSLSFEGGKNQILLILGNGIKDLKVVRWLTQKFNGTQCSIAFPESALKEIQKTKRGLVALEKLIYLLGKHNIEKALFVVDREHIPDFNSIKKWVQEHGCTINEEESLGNKASSLYLTHGFKRFNLYIAIAGEEKSLDEEVQKLFELKCGKAKISYDNKLKEIIKEASKDEGLCEIFEMLEQECKKKF